MVQKSCQQCQELKFADKSGVKYTIQLSLRKLIPVHPSQLPPIVPDVGYRQEGQQRLARRFGKRNFPQKWPNVRAFEDLGFSMYWIFRTTVKKVNLKNHCTVHSTGILNILDH